ncbi:hypothetical protein CI109_100846 [Kwoniella shandongensis]|uniref:Uncharacterized protein n=1 Tax=Kwoniella shandongensis TaxID=1734106 RepID=A0A5M6BVF3_9TREE|nr:uncharacterized protein CI109_006098 [Kwoniella shandongensis]KAA5525525.1 hypothetical protein CI109_006098 [Kwoniella shandongensis]
MSKKPPLDLDQAERANPSFSSSSPNPNFNTRSANRPPDYFNYNPPAGLVSIEFAIWLLVLLVCFMSPNGSGGLGAIVKTDDTFVGLLRQCSLTSCQGWMSTAASTSSSSASSSDSATSSATRRSASLTTRDLTSSLDLPNFFLTTGLASLVSFWMITITYFIFVLPRFFTTPPSPSNPTETDNEGRIVRLKRSYKVFAYRTSRIYLFILGFILLGVAGDASWKVEQAGGEGGGVGIGLILLHASWILTFLSTYLELSRGKIRRWADLGWFGFTCLPCAAKLKVRANKKWDSKSDDGDGDVDQSTGSRSGSRSGSKSGRKKTRDRSKRNMV